MNHHYCQCGHLPKDHSHDEGRCEAVDAGLFGDEPCLCDRYEHDG